ncbi:DNA-binding response regulator [Flavobacterium magnum]|uniref:DNA-binding response regulator n=1 Tax=Flavobacterium magnum TaxID=2162713 RepID=A0A2S0RGX4_9FLAO|nr:LytTR family DNA-binding domain-containing protein [Flavobacterium magnum]AWA31187.1 DNA-binding response regulator [Flavobacterium magnum]
MKLNCVIVDDSSIQRMIVGKLVSNHLNLNLVGEFSNALEAKNFMSYTAIDLLFLDVEMPIVSGFDLLDGLKVKPQVIFITSKPEYAVKAFDYDATDYLQKPITNARFESAIKRAMNLYNMQKDANDEEGDHIFIKSKLKKLKIFTAKIKWIEAYGDYVKVVTEDENHLVLSTMKSFENDLPSDRFVRVHKSYIVNIDKVDKFNSKFAEIGPTKIPLSRNKKEDLKKALEVTS